MKTHKEILHQLIEDLSSQNIENIRNYFTNDSKITVFTVTTGRYTQIQGIEQIIKTLKVTFEDNDITTHIDKIITEQNTGAISGYLQGTRFFTIHLNENEFFRIKFMAFFEFRENMIQSFDYSSDTFEAMRLSGIATIRLGNREKITKYLAILKDSGMIPEKMILPSTI